jgi:hypothetical protein
MLDSTVRLLRPVAAGLALLGVAACCCPRERCCPPGGAAQAQLPPAVAAGTGVLTVASVPDGDVWIDGVAAGTTPLEARVASGAHEVRVRLGGFDEHVANVTVGAGARAAVAVRLVARDVEDRQVLQMLASRSKVWVQPFTAPAVLRGQDVALAVAPVYPRGQVRLEDLGDVRVDFAGKPAAGEVRFRRGDDVLAATSADAEGAGAWIRPIPEAVKTALASGDVVTWGFHPKEGEAVETSFEVVDKDLEGTLASLEEGLQGQPKAALSYLKIQVLADAGLPYGAHQEAVQLIKKGQGTVRAWAAVLETLEKMGAPKTSLAWREAQSRIAGFSRAQQSEVFSGGDYAVTKALDQMRLGHAGRALQALDAERMSTLAQSAPTARRATTEAAAGALRMAERSPSSARKLADALLKMAKSARDQAPQDPEARWALAEAQIAQARTQKALGDKVKPDAWREAADTVVGSYDVGAVDDGLAFLRGVQWLREAAAGAAPADRAKLLDAAKALAERAKEKYPDSGPAAAAAATHLLARAEADAPKEAKARVLEAVAVLQPFLARDPVDPAVSTAHTELATLDRTKALKAGLEYRTESVVTEPDLARFRLPASERWVKAADLPEGFLVYLEQRAGTGDVVRAISVRAAKWGSDYVFPSGQTSGGENTSLLAKYDLEETRRGLAKLKDQGRVEKVKFSKAFAKADAYDARGTDRDGAFRRTQGWFFRSEKSRVTFLVSIDEYRGAPQDDPEVALFRESFEDVAPAK